MNSWTFVSRSAEKTFAIGRELGRSIGADGLVIALAGPLGAGKTVFVKGLAEGLGLDPRSVSSPTFVIAQQYPLPEGGRWLHHVDLYRLESADELETIGFDDMLAPGAVLAVEWADRFPEAMGRDYLKVEFGGPEIADAVDEEAVESSIEGAPRRSRVSVVGREEGVTSLVARDWFERVAALASSEGADDEAGRAQRSGTASTLGIAMLALGMSLYSAIDAEARSAPASPCPSLVSLEADAIGTSLAACDPDALLGGRVGGRASKPSGMGRLLEGKRVDANMASKALLDALPSVGPVRAEAIVRERAIRPFVRLEDLERVHGIGPATRRTLAAWLAVDEDPGRGRR